MPADGILAAEHATALNLDQTEFDFGHWPGDIDGWHSRIMALTDLLLPVAPAIVRRGA